MTHAQKIRELELQLSRWETDPGVGVRARVDLLNELAWALSDTEMQRAYALGERAYAQANSPDEGEPPYQAGMAYSLRTQGYINQRLGDYPRGLTQLFTAQGMFEALELHDGLADVFDGLAGIYYQAGDLPESFKFMQRQLEAAQLSGDEHRVANAYNNLGIIYHAMGDTGRTLDTLHANLRRATELNYERIEFLSCVNLSGIYGEIGDHASALEFATRALDVSHRAGFELFEAHAFDLTGRAYLQLGEFAQAIRYLELGLGSARRLDAKVTETALLQSMGKAHRDANNIDQAMYYLSRCIATAESVDEKSQLVDAHLLLSQIYEEKGDLGRALAHLQKHIEVKEIVFGENANKRLRVLQVTHDVETARREAEIYQLKSQQLEREMEEQRRIEQALQVARDNLERQVRSRTSELTDTVRRLQQEVAARERAEAEIQQMVETLEQRVAIRTEELAALFDLTLLAGGATDLNEVFEQALPRIMEVTRSRAVSVHILDTDGAALRLVAQQGLSDGERARVERVALPPAIRSWLQQPNDPVVITNSADMSAQPAVGGPPAFHLPGFKSYLGAQIRIGKRTEGLMSYFRHTDRGFGLDEIALGTALAEQMGTMLEIHRLRENAEAMAVLQERQRLARDLHDSVTQSLYSLSLFSRAAREAAEDDDVARLSHNLIELERNTLHVLREMRLLLYELRPADLQREGLVRAIELRLNAVERRANLQVNVRMDELAGLAPELEVDLYHIVEEALNNIVKHAAATEVSLQLKQTGRDLFLRMTDDGQGFDATQTGGGMGLRNIRERVARSHGRVSIKSRRGEGTRLEVTIPIVGGANHE